MKIIKNFTQYCRKNYKNVALIFIIVSLILVIVDLELKLNGSSYQSFNFTKSSSEVVYDDFDQVHPEGSARQTVQAPSAMFVKNASIDVKVKSVDTFETKLLQWQRSHEATLLSASFYKQENVKEGSISMRIDKNDFENLKTFLKDNSVEIARLDVYGHDILDSYNDNLERLKLLEATKEKIQSFYDKTNDVKSLMAIQRELLNVEQQIAEVKRSTQNAEIQSKTMVVTIYVVTDESYKPIQKEVWKPIAVIKDAWSSVVKSLEAFLNIIIWVLVYSVIWLPLMIIVLILWRRNKKLSKKS